MSAEQVAASDQMKMWMRDLADMEANFYDTLVERKIPRRIAIRMTEELHKQFIASTFRTPASVLDIFK